MTGKNATARRLRPRAVLPLLLAALVLASVPAAAKPTQQEVEGAEARLDELVERMDIMVEEYDQTLVALQEAQSRLGALRDAQERSERRARIAQERLDDIAAEAYRNPTGALDAILSSESLGQLTERLKFLEIVAEVQSDTALEAEVAGERARDAAASVSDVVAQQRDLLAQQADQKAEIDAAIAEQSAIVDELAAELEEWREQQAALAAAAERAAAQPELPAPGSPPAPVTPPPAVFGEGAAAAIAAAESQIGVPYQYGGASPETGFDCSGLTMWAWAHGGVSLPHSSAMQYDSLPHVPRDQLMPGDLVFFYDPIHHVGLYVGGGMMIHAPHTGSYVERIPVYWEYFVGAARPG